MRKNKVPLVSVIMPVYNGNGFLKGAIESIRRQSYKNIEFIVVNDGSTDEVKEILLKYKKSDPRIRVFNFKRRRGFEKTINFAISKVHGQFIIRMDADDISAPDRIEKQLKYLLQNDEVVAVGGQSKIIDSEGRIIGIKYFPDALSSISSHILSLTQVQKPPLMIARFRLPKDFTEIDNTAKLMQWGRIENLAEVIFYYRIHDKNAALRTGRNAGVTTLLKRKIKEIRMFNFIPTRRKNYLKMRFAGKA